MGDLCKCELDLKCISLGTKQKNAPAASWELIQIWWCLSGGKTGNHGDVFMRCLFFLAFLAFISWHWARFLTPPHPPKPLTPHRCSSLSVTHWHLPAAKAHTDSLGSRSWLECRAARMLLWNVPWEMSKAQTWCLLWSYWCRGARK